MHSPHKPIHQRDFLPMREQAPLRSVPTDARGQVRFVCLECARSFALQLSELLARFGPDAGLVNLNASLPEACRGIRGAATAAYTTATCAERRRLSRHPPLSARLATLCLRISSRRTHRRMTHDHVSRLSRRKTPPGLAVFRPRGMSGPVKLHGIRNCDTMRKAWTWLDQAGVAYDFHDYKKQGIDQASLQRWAGQVGWEVLLNRAGTTFRALPDADKVEMTQDKAIGLMLAQPSMIKRPVLEADGGLLVGFKPEAYAARFG